jgi:uncharacterized protein (TIGR00255 family)
MIKSMTAFGRAERVLNGCSYTVEMRCVNRRYCEVKVHMPAELLSLEESVKKWIGAKISRGRVEVTIRRQADFTEAPEVKVNHVLAETYYRALCELNESLNTGDTVRLQTLLGLDRIIVPTEPEIDLEETQKALHACVCEALESIDVMRIREGERIYQDFCHRLDVVDREVAQLREMAPSVFAEYQNKLSERIVRLTEGKVDLDPNRLAQEAAFLADKSDITEEIVRAESHLHQFRSMIDAGGAVGRALDFLLQELNREINTIGSKAGDAGLSQKVVGIKSELEKVREQVQNIE